MEVDTTSTLSVRLLPWLEATLASLNNGIRRQDNELVVAWVPYPVAGVVSVSKQHFVLSQITALANHFPKSFVAALAMPNRAADLRSAAKCPAKL